MTVNPNSPDSKVYKKVSAQITDDTGHTLGFFENGEVTPSTINLMIVGGRFNSSLPTLANNAASMLQLDTNGRLIVTFSSDTVDSPIVTTTVMVGGAEAATVGSLTQVSTDGDATRIRTTKAGVLFATIVTPTGGVAQDIGTDNSAASSNPNGIFPLIKYESTLPTYANNDAAVLHSDALGRLVTTIGGAGTATLSNVAGNASSVTLISSNANRKGAAIYNDSAAVLRVKFGATASATSFTIYMAANSQYVFTAPVYTGIVDGIWESATGNARITEIE